MIEVNVIEEMISLDQVVMDDSLQVRSKLDHPTIVKYAEQMAADVDFPPVKIARIADKLFLVDGWHRISAARRNNSVDILAVISDMSREEALWAAAQANLTHGLPIKKGERREVFRAYVRAGQHKRGLKLKSYRDIASELGGLAGHTTLRGWMQKDFRKIFNSMGGPEGQRNPDAGPPKVDPDLAYRRQAKEALEHVLNFADLLKNSGYRYEIIQATEKVLEAMKKKPHEKPEQDEF
jgi:hypothetical protein